MKWSKLLYPAPVLSMFIGFVLTTYVYYGYKFITSERIRLDRCEQICSPRTVQSCPDYKSQPIYCTGDPIIIYPDGGSNEN